VISQDQRPGADSAVALVTAPVYGAFRRRRQCSNKPRQRQFRLCRMALVSIWTSGSRHPRKDHHYTYQTLDNPRSSRLDWRGTLDRRLPHHRRGRRGHLCHRARDNPHRRQEHAVSAAALSDDYRDDWHRPNPLGKRLWPKIAVVGLSKITQPARNSSKPIGQAARHAW
jgi:hypothetical protein